MSERRYVCRRSDLRPGRAGSVLLHRDRYGLPLECLVVLDDEGHVRAYLNVCKHLPIPLDGGTGDYFDDSRTHLFCGTHGARYRLADGRCVEGPCRGEHLDAVAVEIEGDEIFVRWTPQDD